MIPHPVITYPNNNNDSMLYTWTIQGVVSIETVKERLQSAGYYPDGYECNCTHDCCGHLFSRPVEVKHRHGVTTVAQRLYRNV